MIVREIPKTTPKILTVIFDVKIEWVFLMERPLESFKERESQVLWEQLFIYSQKNEASKSSFRQNSSGALV